MKTMTKLKLFFALAWKVSPSYIILLILQSALGSVQILLNVILPKYLIEAMVAKASLDILGQWVLIIIFSNLFFEWLNLWMKKIMYVKNLYVRDQMSLEMARKIMFVEYQHLENPYYLDLKERAVFALNNQNAMFRFVEALASFLKYSTTVVSLLVLLWMLSKLLVLTLLLVIGLSWLIYRTFMNFQMQFFGQLIPINRKYGYYVNLFFQNKLAKDIRLYGMKEMLIQRVKNYTLEIIEYLGKYARKQGLYLGIYNAMNDLQAAIAYGYVGIRVLSDRFGPRISLGSFTMYVNAAIQFSLAVGSLGLEIITLMQVLGYLDPFMEFMLLEEEQSLGGTLQLHEVHSIAFEHVSFQYPGSKTEVLHDISFTIQQKEKISIVGLNGAGKTTLVKLLCRMYQPTQGKILVNGRDMMEYEESSYRKQMAAIFQDYKLFAFSIKENIQGSAMAADCARMDDIIAEVGMKEKIASLPDGIEARFGKAYDENGIELSGGEGQKIAIARALYKDASFIILDEPTSALDPLAEADIYQNFNHLVGTKTAIYISHRMSSSVFCDKILIIDQGSVSDYDTHEALMKKTDSLYYQLFQSQAQNYQLS